MFMGKLAATFYAAALLMALSSTLSATTPPPPMTTTDVYEANYFLGLHQPHYPGQAASIPILDPGTNGKANLCADIYVLNPSEELEACCSCPLTPDEILTGSVVDHLLSNNVSPIWLANGVIKIISDSKCNAAKPTPTPEMVAWLTRTDFASFPNNPTVTTTQFASAGLSTAELNSLATRCGDIVLVGSGYGTCTCPTEPPNGF
jgi:hypothetical protein